MRVITLVHTYLYNTDCPFVPTIILRQVQEDLYEGMALVRCREALAGVRPLIIAPFCVTSNSVPPPRSNGASLT